MKSNVNLKERFIAEYAPLVKQFRDELLADGSQPEVYKNQVGPILPIVGKMYAKAKYQFAFVGIDTNGWYKVTDFLQTAKNGIEEAIYMYQWFLEGYVEGKITCLNCLGTPFWRFIFNFLSEFYHVDYYDIKAGKYTEIVQSFIWGDMNAIEHDDNGDDLYWKAKEASKIFDSASHIINSVNPKVIILLAWNDDADEWLRASLDKNNEPKVINDHLWYYYLEDSETHVFWTGHPGWLNRQRRLYEQMQVILDKIKEYNVWEELPGEPYTSLPTK